MIEWCEHHRNDPVQTNEEENDARKKVTDIDDWDQKFMQVDQEMLFEIILVRYSTPHSPGSFTNYLAGGELHGHQEPS